MLLDYILYEDAEAILLDKPAGLPVDAPRAGGASVAAALDGLRLGFARPPSIVHRLDRDTSGVLLLARHPRAHRRFAAAFEAGAVIKTYLAVLAGVPAEAGGTVSLALAKRSTEADGWRMVPDPAGRAAETEWRVLGIAEGRALALLMPASGRTHQLRVHAASGIGVPIAGDPVYGRGPADAGGPMLLHAWRLVVPRAGKPALAGEAPPPPAFDRWRPLLEAADAAA